jgi:hypothetical protein
MAVPCPVLAQNTRAGLCVFKHGRPREPYLHGQYLLYHGGIALTCGAHPQPPLLLGCAEPPAHEEGAAPPSEARGRLSPFCQWRRAGEMLGSTLQCRTSHEDVWGKNDLAKLMRWGRGRARAQKCKLEGPHQEAEAPAPHQHSCAMSSQLFTTPFR